MCSEIGYPKSKQTRKAKKVNLKRMTKVMNIRFISFLLDRVVCQVCDESLDLDTPHHEPRGINKDDWLRVNICVECHRIRHGSIKGELKKSIKEIEQIAIENREEFKRVGL